MGWEYAPVGDAYGFRIQDLPFATAEGVVTLAALVECLREKPNSRVTFEVSDKARAWSDGLQLGQLIKGRWLSFNKFPFRFSRPAGCYSYPLWRELISNRSSCHIIGERLAEQVELILEDLKQPSANEVAFAAKSVFEEALLNVFEHAYDPDIEKIAFGAITVTPVPRVDQLRRFAYVTSEEASWFNRFTGSGLMLEIAVADFGKNIPFTLWKAYKTQFPKLFDEYQSVNLGTHRGRLKRAKLHHQISLWALNHRSTRKSKAEFENELAFLNWRGLHRAVNTAAKLSGCMIVRSGQARTGYAFHGDSSSRLEAPTESRQHEFPGTSITLRIPIPKTRRTPVLIGVDLEPSELDPPLKIEKIVKSSDILTDLRLHLAGKSKIFGISNPFITLKADQIVTLLHTSLSMSPHIIPIHFFMDIDPPTALSQLASFDDRRLGPPRLVAFWKADQRLIWRLVGVMPTEVRQMIEALEQKGTSVIGSDAVSRRFAENLARAYSPFVETRDGEISLLLFKSQPTSEIIHDALQSAFELWAENSKKIWRFDEPGRFVRLRTGRLIKNYISVYRLLESDDFVAREMGRRFVTILRSFEHQFPNLCVVTDSEASYFIARMLLQDFRPAPEIYVGSPPKGSIPQRPVIAFIDAIHKGDTLRALILKTKACRGIICCIDLRESPESASGGFEYAIHPLLRYPFDPREVQEETIAKGNTVLEVDAVTHIPEEGAAIELLSLGTSIQRDEFINSNPQFFQYGIQQRTGRIDVVRLSVAEVVHQHKDRLLDWVEEAVGNEVIEIGGKEHMDVVIFTRNEASINTIVSDLGDRLVQKKSLRIKRAFKAILPFVTSGTREIFSRPTPELFRGLEQVSGERDLFGGPPSNFLALYLDDACVTGKSLLNFLNRASMARLDQLPNSILAVPILSRFSPAEETFFGETCRRLTAQTDPDKQVRFSLVPQFRLQVRSFDLIESTSAYQLLMRLAANKSWLDERLSRYLDQRENNFRVVAPDLRGRDAGGNLNSHPFYGGVQFEREPPSSRVIRIRHLIALQEQNVGVLSTLLHELWEVFKNNDYTLLKMLALEPSLMEVSPLNKGARHDITRLAMNAILSQDSPAIKSDALCVLALQGQVLIDRLPEILRATSLDTDLVDQLLVFLFSGKTTGSMWYGEVGNALRETAPDLATPTYNYLQSWLQSFDEITEQRPVLTEHDARSAITNLIAQTSYHGEGLDKLDALSDWVFSSESKRNSRDGLVVQRIVYDVSAFFRDVVLPGIDGLSWWAEFREQNPRAAAALNRSFRKLIPLLNQLTVSAQPLTSGPIGPTITTEIEELWESIRGYSLTSQADTFLSKTAELPAEDIPILEYWVPKFFCLPKEIVSGLASYSLEQFDLKADWELLDQGKVIIAVPFALEAVQRVFSLLIQDMRNHGTRGGNKIQLSIKHKDGLTALEVLFENRIRKQDVSRTGQSQELARNIAHKSGFDMTPHPPAKAGQAYRVAVTLPNALYLQWS